MIEFKHLRTLTRPWEIAVRSQQQRPLYTWTFQLWRFLINWRIQRHAWWAVVPAQNSPVKSSPQRGWSCLSSLDEIQLQESLKQRISWRASKRTNGRRLGTWRSRSPCFQWLMPALKEYRRLAKRTLDFSSGFWLWTATCANGRRAGFSDHQTFNSEIHFHEPLSISRCVWSQRLTLPWSGETKHWSARS